MLSLSNLPTLAGAKPIGSGSYSVAASPHHTSAKNATTISSGSSSHHYSYSNATSINNGTTSHDGMMINWGFLRCPQNMGNDSALLLLPTPTYGTEGRAWMVCAETLIRAPPRRVYDALLDFGRYRDWNSYITDVEIVHPTSRVPIINATTASPNHAKVYEGMDLTFTFHGLGGEDVVTTGPEVLTVLSAGGSGSAAIKSPSSSECENPACAKTSAKKVGAGVGGKKNRYLMSAWRSDLTVAGELIRSEHPNTYYEGKSTETFKLLQAEMRGLNEQQGRDLKAYLEKKGTKN
ncbi:hypothetical protein PG994_003940 [Apiospora phragmitis]|uniref:Uncharacterized protein n=1 Tax=Apiospora phragmitis TaxID=2905665 RepID=A0ABR1W3E2_9PEZI